MGSGWRNNKIGNIRCDIFKNRTTENLQKLIYNHIKKNNNINMDGWCGYIFLDDEDAEYSNEVYVHRLSRILGFYFSFNFSYWRVLGYFERLYKKNVYQNSFKKFLLYLPEAKMPYIMRDYSIKEKENKLIEIFEYLYNIVNYELYDLDEIEEPYAYDY